MIKRTGMRITACLLIDPKLIRRPSGSEKTSVEINNCNVDRKPFRRVTVTVVNKSSPVCCDLLGYERILKAVLLSRFLNGPVIIELLELIVKE